MIRISMDVDAMLLEVTGHAHSAPKGQDIVCAAVSTLVYTLAQNLMLTLHDEDYSVILTEGHSYIEAHPPEAQEDQCHHVFMTIANGLCMLEAQYGQYIHFEGN